MHRSVALLEGMAVLLSATLLAVLVALWAQRIGHPFDLEWMEGGMLVHAWRLQHGLPLYPEPSREWIPYLYPAGFPAVLAGLGDLFGLSYPLGRLVSLGGTLAAAGAIAWGVRAHGGRWPWALAGAAIFLGAYEFSGAFYDLVRLDGLNIGLLAWAVVLGSVRRRGAVEASALLLAAAFLVKQHVALFGIPMLLGLWLRDGWPSAGRFLLWSAVPALGITLWIQGQTGGQYLTYLLAVPASHGMVGGRVFPGVPRELGYAMGPALAVVLTALVPWTAARVGGLRVLTGLALGAVLLGAGVDALLPDVAGVRDIWPGLRAPLVGLVLGGVVVGLAGGAAHLWRLRGSWGWVYAVGIGGVALLSTALMRGHVGGFLNVHIQLHWVVALGAAFLVARSSGPPLLQAGLALGVVLQLGWMLGHTALGTPPLPSSADRAAGEAVVEALAEAPGPVWSPVSPWLAHQAGHPPSFHLMALWDITRPRGPMPEGPADVRRAVEEGYWATVVRGTRGLEYGVPTHYEEVADLPVPRGALVPKTGWRDRPQSLLRPRETP